MSNKYLLYKFCKNGDRHLITWLTASGMDEANQAVKLLRKKHPGIEDLELGDGEFFEIVEEHRLKPGEWEQALQVLAEHKGGLHQLVTKGDT